MFVVVEGLDGAGKSTQVARLRKYLGSRFGAVEYIHFPRYDSPVYGDLISKFLRGGFGDIASVDPQLVALLYAEDRHGAADTMRSVLDSGSALLLDRYVYSNVAYQCAKINDPASREALRRWILDTEYGAFGLPRPDVNIFLDVPTAFVRERLSANRSGDDRDYLAGGQDIHEADFDFQTAVRQVYLEECRKDPSFIRIDCSSDSGEMLPEADIFDKIKACLETFSPQ